MSDDDLTLYDVFDESLPDPTTDEGPPTICWRGLFIMHTGSGRFQVQYDGHLDIIHRFHRDDYDDVLELVDDLVDLVVRYDSLFAKDRYDGTDELIEWAGKIMVFDEEKANENPDRFVHVPAYEEVTGD